MTFDSTYGDGNVTETKLPDGKEFAYTVAYTGAETRGVIVLLVVSVISLIAVIGLLFAIARSAWTTRRAPKECSLFVRTHVAAYFVSMLVCDGLQAIGSIMSSKWVADQQVRYGTYCVIQGVTKQVADVGTATWSLAIALHTFSVLFLKVKVPRYVMYMALLTGWGFIAAIVCIGPFALDTAQHGRFFAISGLWCWIGPGHQTPRTVLDYMEMFGSAIICFILYTLIFLRVRGNITRDSGHWYFSSRARNRDSVVERELYGHTIARRMIWFPVAYTALLLPIAIARFLDWHRVSVPWKVTIFCDAVFLLSGVVNVALFWVTRSLLPRKSVVVVSRPALVNTATHSLPLSVFVDLSVHRSADDKVAA